MVYPLYIRPIKENGRSQEYIGEDARVVVNPDTGNMITAWKTSRKLRENYKKGGIKVICFSNEQVILLKKIKAPIDTSKKLSELSDDEYFRLEEFIADYFQIYGIEANDDVNDVGVMCESIIDVLSEV